MVSGVIVLTSLYVLCYGVPGGTNHDALARVRKGMQKSEVISILGAPEPVSLGRAPSPNDCSEVLIYRERKNLILLRWFDERMRHWVGGMNVVLQVCVDDYERVRETTWQLISN
jgi:hypothetical protein